MILKCIVCKEDFLVNEADMKAAPLGTLVHNWIQRVGDIDINIKVTPNKGEICLGCATQLLKLFAEEIEIPKNQRQKELRVELY